MENHADGSRDNRKLGELVADVEVAMMTTIAADGSLVSRPLQTLEIDVNGDLVFFTSASSGKVDDLARQSRVNLAYANPAKHTYVSVSGHASIEQDRGLIDSLWSPAHKAFFPKGKDDPDLAVLRVRVEDAEYWESSGGFVGRALRFARAAAGAGPDALGDHRRLEL